MRAPASHDQDQQRKNHRAGRDKLAAQDARMDSDPPGERKGLGRQQRDPPVPHDQAHEACEDQHATGRDQQAEHPSGAHGMGQGGFEGRSVGGRRHRRQ
jgi:hypothetical protein